jgi:membrane protein DedA with SNARE-associated domain
MTPRLAINIHQFVETYGYLAVFVLVGAESFGIPVPGETALVAASAYAGATHVLAPGTIFVVGSAAAILGDTGGYWIGSKGGYPLLRRYGHLVRFDEPKLKVARYLFARHGGKVVFFGRFVSVLRTYAAFLAGVSKMHYPRFLLFNAGGGIIWCAVYTFGAYWFGSAITTISRPIEIVVVLAAIAIVVLGIVAVGRRMEDLKAKAEAAYPGPLDD